MSSPRLLQRVPSVQCVSVAKLAGHQLKFHKRGHDGSAKCDIALTDNPQDIVYGVVYRFAANEKPKLDFIEGLGSGYNEKLVQVIDQHNTAIEAVTYFATDIDNSLKPFHWYKEHVVRGANEHGLPKHYIKLLESVISIADPNHDNHQRELSIYTTLPSL